MPHRATEKKIGVNLAGANEAATSEVSRKDSTTASKMLMALAGFVLIRSLGFKTTFYQCEH
jgi:hypothetical protein